MKYLCVLHSALYTYPLPLTTMKRNTKQKTEEIQGIFATERFVFQDGEPGRTIIGTLDDGRCIKGEAKRGELQMGVLYRFDGHWNQHPKYGNQFLFHSFCQPEPTTKEALIGYLATCPHIGTLRAERIVDCYGLTTLDMLKTSPNVVAQNITGLSLQNCKDIQENLLARVQKEGYTIEINKMLNGHGIPKKVFTKLYEDFGTKATEVIRDNPFVLMNYKGVGFLKSDEIYLSLGNDPKSVVRQMHRLHYAMQSEQNGSTLFKKNKLKDALFMDMDDDDLFEQAVKMGLENELFVEYKNNLCLKHYFYSEQKITKFMIGCNERQNRWPNELSCQSTEHCASEHQIAAYKDATYGPVGLLIGAPGTGKTWLVAQIVKTLHASNRLVAVVAPTNKAANRIAETFQSQGVDAGATTIHSLLGAEIDDGMFRFRYDEKNKLPCDFVIVDESSMVDSGLMASLLSALPDDANILFVGDQDQLSPVGRGAPLRDMIEIGLPCGKLSEIRRNAGAIVKACHTIKSETMFDCHVRSISEATDENNLVLLQYDPKNVMATIQKIIAEQLLTITPVNTQVIVATNEKSPVSRVVLNKELRKYFNPNADEAQRISEGDKVICLANGNAKLATEDKTIRVANGDIGFVEQEMKESYYVNIYDKIVVVPKNSDQWGAYDFDLGYAITCHKSQGSEWPIVIIALDPSFAGGMVCDRHWIYTAISRARQRCYILGSESQIRTMIRKSNMWNRKTTLVEQYQDIKWSHLVSCWEREIEYETIK